jgi:hypothetical protein
VSISAAKGLTMGALGTVNADDLVSLTASAGLNSITGLAGTAKTTLTISGGLGLTLSGVNLTANTGVTLSSPQTTSVSDSTIASLAAMTVGGNAQVSIDNSDLSSFNNLAVSTTASTASISVLNGSSLAAGTLQQGVGSGVLITQNIATTGALNMTTSGSGGITIGDNVSFTSNGSDLSIKATGSTADITVGSNGRYAANGGNVYLMAMGKVTDGASGVATNNDLHARAVSNFTTSTGGGIELGSGTTTSTLASAFAKPHGTVPPDGSIGTLGFYTINNNGDTTGAVVANKANGGTVNITNGTPTNNPAVLNLQNKGAIVFDAIKAGSKVELNGVTMTVEAYLPVAYHPGAAVDVYVDEDNESTEGEALAHIAVEGGKKANTLRAAAPKTNAVINLASGSIFLHPLADMTVRTAVGDVKVRKGALVSIQCERGSLRVAACSGPGDVSIRTEGRMIAVAPGQEVLIADHKATSEEIEPFDGIGRRNASTQVIGNGMTAVLSDFSIVSLASNATHLRALRAPASMVERSMFSRLAKTAAAVETLTREHGRYAARSRVQQPEDVEMLTPVKDHGRAKSDLRASL